MNPTSSTVNRERRAPAKWDARAERVFARALRYCDAFEQTQFYRDHHEAYTQEAGMPARVQAYLFKGDTYTRNMLVHAFMMDRQVLEPQSDAYFTAKQVATHIKSHKSAYNHDPEDSEPEPSTEDGGVRDPVLPKATRREI
ncbi:hypothetical protein JCM11641_004758 [Rhodosporidiobolus odoratus]